MGEVPPVIIRACVGPTLETGMGIEHNNYLLEFLLFNYDMNLIHNVTVSGIWMLLALRLQMDTAHFADKIL